MTEYSTEIVTVDNAVQEKSLARTIGGLNASQGVRGDAFFSTITGDDRNTKLQVLAALSDSEPLKGTKEATLWIEHVIVQPVEMPDQDGVMQLVPRIVLIDADGKAYHAMSGPLLRSIENIFGIMGPQNTWGDPLPIKVVEEGKAPRAYYVAKIDLKATFAKK